MVENAEWPPIRSIFGTELIAERDGDVVRLGARNLDDGPDLTFLVTDEEARWFAEQVAALVGCVVVDESP